MFNTFFQGGPRDLRLISEGVWKRKRQILDFGNHSQVISPFVTWEGPSKSRSAREHRPKRMMGYCKKQENKHFVKNVLHFRKASKQASERASKHAIWCARRLLQLPLCLSSGSICFMNISVSINNSRNSHNINLIIFIVINNNI